eukprot:1185455-Prorocentrum_minimum.AAC.4
MLPASLAPGDPWLRCSRGVVLPAPPVTPPAAAWPTWSFSPPCMVCHSPLKKPPSCIRQITRRPETGQPGRLRSARCIDVTECSAASQSPSRSLADPSSPRSLRYDRLRARYVFSRSLASKTPPPTVPGSRVETNYPSKTSYRLLGAGELVRLEAHVQTLFALPGGRLERGRRTVPSRAALVQAGPLVRPPVDVVDVGQVAERQPHVADVAAPLQLVADGTVVKRKIETKRNRTPHTRTHLSGKRNRNGKHVGTDIRPFVKNRWENSIF